MELVSSYIGILSAKQGIITAAFEHRGFIPVSIETKEGNRQRNACIGGESNIALDVRAVFEAFFNIASCLIAYSERKGHISGFAGSDCDAGRPVDAAADFPHVIIG